MDKNKLNPKTDKNVFYITFAIVLAFVVFNFQTVVYTLLDILSLATPFYIAIIIAFILNIPMKQIERLLKKIVKNKKLKLAKDHIRGIALFTTLALFILVLGLFSSVIFPRISESITLIFTSLGDYEIRLSRFITSVAKDLHINFILTRAQVNDFFRSVNLSTLLETIGRLLGANKVGNITSVVNSISGTTITAITSFFMSLYILANKEKHVTQFRKGVIYFIGEDQGIRILQVTDEANHYFNHFITGAVLEASIFMTLVYIFLRIFNLPFPELIALCAFLFSFIPMFGSFMTLCIGMVLVAAASSNQLILFIILFVCIQQFEGNFVYPRIVGRSVGISGLYVLLGITIFGKLFGLIGVLMGVPLTALIYALVSRMINIHLYRRNIEVKHNEIVKLDEKGNKKNTIY